MEQSFSRQIKREIMAPEGGDRHCRVALAMALVNCAYDASNGGLRPLADSPLPGEKLGGLTKRDFGGGLDDPGTVARLLAAAGGGRFDPLVVKSPCCKRAYIRGAFLCAGYVADPARANHLEFAAHAGKNWDDLAAQLAFFGLKPAATTRKGRAILYFKEGERIAEILNIIGAHVGLMAYENSRALRDVNNAINRLANCETANADKLVAAAVRQVEDIRKLERTIGLGALPPKLEEAARARLRYPTLPLSEIAGKLSEPVSKSGIGHRLRRISQIAEELDNG